MLCTAGVFLCAEFPHNMKMEIISNSILLILSLVVVVRGARVVVRYAPALACMLGMSDFLASFLVIGVVSVFPELSIAVISGLREVPTLGLGTLYDSNVADLTLVLGIAALFAKKGLKIKSDFLKEDLILIAPLLVPVFLGLDGEFSRMDGWTLVTIGLVLFAFLYRKDQMSQLADDPRTCAAEPFKALALFFFGLAALVGGAYGIVFFAERIAGVLSLPEVLMGISFVTLGTLAPELTFSMKAAGEEKGELILGDILGIVITDITLVLGLMAAVRPFTFNPELVSLTGFAMIFGALISLNFVKSGSRLSKTEGVVLIMLYILFLVTTIAMHGNI